MADYPTFPNAPIAEAILDIRVSLPEETTLEILSMFQDRLGNHFKDRQERFHLEATFPSTDQVGENISSTHKKDGFLFKSTTEAKVVQARLDGYTFNKLPPYESWSIFVSEAKKLWSVYMDIAKPKSINRLGIRYINRIEIKLPVGSFSEYMRIPPNLPPELPQSLANFLMRFVFPYENIGVVAVVTQTLDKAMGSVLPIIFDVDVFKDGTFECASDEVWDTFEKMRCIKNDIFLNAFTDKAKDLFA